MFSFPEASQILKSPLLFANPHALCYGASMDTRTLHAGDLFVALPGRHQDGHLFLEEAFAKKAAGAIIAAKVYEAQRERFEQKGIYQNLLAVRDPLQSFQELARWHRSQFRLPCVGVTGSVGKTTTKEFIAGLLRPHFRVLATPGNYNNHLGLPLTLLRLCVKDQFCVAELGANHEGEIGFLARILQPTLGVITRIAPAHLEGFGSLEAIYRTKLELFCALPKGAPAVMGDDDPPLLELTRLLHVRPVLVGRTPAAHYRITREGTDRRGVWFEINRKWRFRFPGHATFLVRNAAMAVAVVRELGVPWDQILTEWPRESLPAGRFEERWMGGSIHVICDGYNASPAAFESALETFQALPSPGRKILVFADMLELGALTGHYHEELGRKIGQSGIEVVLAYGSWARVAVRAAKEIRTFSAIEHFPTKEDLGHFLRQMLRPGDLVLFKASRGMKIDELVDNLSYEYSAST